MTTADFPDASGRAERNAVPAIPVVSVLVFEDRAQVTRAATVPVPEALVTITIEGVSPLAVERTIDATAPAGAVVSQVRMRRWLERVTADRLTGDPMLQAAYDDAVDDERRALRRTEQLDMEIEALHALRDLTLQELAQSANDAAIDLDDAGGQLASVRTAEERLRVARAEAAAVHRAAWRTLEDVEARLHAGQALASDWRATLEVDLAPAPAAATATGPGPGSESPGPAELVVRYVVPNAAWRPAHVATRVDGAAAGTTVTVHSDAVVWQATDEVWEDVELTLSTARTSSATDPPPVDDDVLHLVEAGREIEVTWREVDDIVGEAAVFAVLPSVDDGGEARTLQAQGRVTVEPDGLPTRVPVASFTTVGTADLVCRPERDLAVHRRTRQANEQAVPLLAGPVLLVEDGGVSGWTTLGYVGPGERFELGWGREAALAVDRRLEDRDEGTLTGATETDHRVLVELHNNGVDARSVEVVERVPVSEIDRVQVSIDEVRPAASPDADGFVRWSVTVPPGGATAQLALAYTVRRHRSVAP